MQIKLPRAPWLRILAICSPGLLAILAASLFVMHRLSQNADGVCVDSGRVFSESELRQAVIRNLIQIDVDNANRQKDLFNEIFRTGIVKSPPKTVIRNLLDEFFDNGKSFEENFSIEVIAPGNRGFDLDTLQEPFLLIGYGTMRRDGAAIMASTDIHKIENSERLQKQHTYSLYERYRGFGKHFYRMKRTLIEKDCCDNNNHGRSEEEYLADKRTAYIGSKNSFDRNLAVLELIAQVSNCGAILTFKEEDTGFDLTSIQWIREQ